MHREFLDSVVDSVNGLDEGVVETRVHIIEVVSNFTFVLFLQFPQYLFSIELIDKTG